MSIEAIKTKTVPQITVQTNTEIVNTVTKPYPNDTVELSTKTEQKKSTVKNTAMIIGTSAATLVAATLLFAKYNSKKIAKLYKDKLVLSNLPEKLDFKEAKTVEEGIKFAKEILGINQVDKEFTLDAINIANKGLVDVSNANKGKLFMPTRLRFNAPSNKDDDYLAFVIKDINSPNFGNLVINKNYFDTKILDKELKENLYFDNGMPYYSKINLEKQTYATSVQYGLANSCPSFDLIKLINKFYKDPSKLSITEKQTIFHSLQIGGAKVLRHKRSPYDALIQFSEDRADFLKKNNITIDFDNLKTLSTEKQFEYLKTLADKFFEQGGTWNISYGIESPATVIYHEMGHLQDFAKNLKDLDVKQWKLSLSEVWKNAKHKVKTGEDISRVGVDEVDNRWGTISKEYYEKLYKEKPEKFKKLYPDLYNFLTNQEIQQTSGKVSEYAQTGIGEFIAEVYKLKIAGKKIPDDVMVLYRRYKGPELA